MVIFSFFSKNHALISENKVRCEHLPRVGELVLGHPSSGVGQSTDQYFFVYKVIHEAEADEVVAHVYCRQWFKGLRHEELARRGWLPLDDDDQIEYDED